MHALHISSCQTGQRRRECIQRLSALSCGAESSAAGTGATWAYALLALAHGGLALTAIGAPCEVRRICEGERCAGKMLPCYWRNCEGVCYWLWLLLHGALLERAWVPSEACISVAHICKQRAPSSAGHSFPATCVCCLWQLHKPCQQPWLKKRVIKTQTASRLFWVAAMACVTPC